MTTDYDLIIIGGGPAGLSAAIYALRSGLKTLLIENTVQGGQAALTEKIENYPGIKEISGYDLGDSMYTQAVSLGLETLFEKVNNIDIQETIKIVSTNSRHITSLSVILAMGTTHKKLKVASEDELLNNGLAYCVTCDGLLFKDKEVVVIGGGNSAAEGAIELSSICNKVTIMNDLDKMTCQEIYVQQLYNAKNIDIINSATVKNIVKDENNLRVKYNDTYMHANGVFVLIGRKPNNDLVLNTTLDLEDGYILTDSNMRTNVKGVFAAGDIRYKTYRQVITACSDGAIAALESKNYINQMKSSHIII